jgi:hypothetical protein
VVDDDFTQPENDGVNVNRLVRRDVQVGVNPDTLIPSIIADFKLENGLGDDDILSAAVVKKFRREGNASGEWAVYYRITGTLAPAQTVTVQFTAPQTFTPGDIAQPVNVGVSIITSDAQPLVNPVSVDVRDLLTGSANNPVDYTMVTPQTLNWAPADPSGTVKNAVLNTTGVNTGGDPTVDLDLDGAVVAAEGAQNTHQVVLVTAVP